MRGVTDVVAGFATGAPALDSARIAEAVTVSYDTSPVSYAELPRDFFTVAHYPTQLDRQGEEGLVAQSSSTCASSVRTSGCHRSR